MMMPQSSANGFSLVELVVSMGIGVVISMVVLDVFVNTKQALLMQQGLARIQENARVIGILLGEAIESSGTLGCHAFVDELSVRYSVGLQQIGFKPLVRLIGINADQLAKMSLSTQVQQKIKPNSHHLLIQSLGKYFVLAQPVGPKDEVITVHGKANLKGNQVIAVSDCCQVDFMRAKKIEHHITKNITEVYFHHHHFNKIYSGDAIVGALSARLYYVGSTKRTNVTGTPIYALYSTDLYERTLELIEGVEHILFQYGIKREKSLHYFPAQNIQDWSKVVKVRADILLTSIEDALPKSKAYKIEGKELTPTDRLLRMWWHFEWEIKGNA
ncbi:MAG: PilW family protein [Proteobacteria bacterium]|nr:PilW family protein [Pseudomonadota bacterium]